MELMGRSRASDDLSMNHCEQENGIIMPDRMSFFLSPIPTVSAICRSSSNIDMYDWKFQVSYLIKYISGKEEHQLVDVTGTKEMTHRQSDYRGPWPRKNHCLPQDTRT